MPLKRCVRVIPHVQEMKYPYGGQLSMNGGYDLTHGNCISYRDYNIEFTFNQYPSTRSVSMEPPGLFFGDLSVLAEQYCDIPGERALVSKSWPTCCTILAWDLHWSHTDLALWLPGPPLPGSTGFAHQIMPHFYRENRGSSADSTVSVSYPYGPAVWFREVLLSLPAMMQTLILLIHSPSYVAALANCLHIIGACDHITELRIDFLPAVPWGPDLPEYEGFLQKLQFHGIHDGTMVTSITRLMENNPGLTSVSFEGQIQCLLGLVHWIRRNPNHIVSIDLNLLGPDDSSDLLRAIALWPPTLQKLCLTFSQEPDYDRLRSAISSHETTLQYLSLVFPQTTTMHYCSHECEEFRFLDLMLPVLEELHLQFPPCTAFVLNQILRYEHAFRLKLRPNSFEYQIQLGNFVAPPEIEPSPVTSLYLEGVHDIHHFAVTTRHFWNNVNTLTVSGLSIFDISAVLTLAPAVEELILMIEMGHMHTSSPMEGGPDCGMGLADHCFFDDQDHNVAVAAAELRNLRGLRCLRLLFTHESHQSWETPSLGLCFGNRVLANLPALQKFESNEVSRDLQHMLVTTNMLHNGNKSCQLCYYVGERFSSFLIYLF